MTITEVYAQYRHLDHLLSDPRWVAGSLPWQMLRDCWVAVKTAALEEQQDHDAAAAENGGAVAEDGTEA